MLCFSGAGVNVCRERFVCVAQVKQYKSSGLPVENKHFRVARTLLKLAGIDQAARQAEAKHDGILLAQQVEVRFQSQQVLLCHLCHLCDKFLALGFSFRRKCAQPALGGAPLSRALNTFQCRPKKWRR